MALSTTRICNSALARTGSKRINNFEDETEGSVQAIHCRTHYEITRDSLLRSHYWRFASARAELSQDTTDPDFEWDNQFILPNDFLRMKSIYDDVLIKNTRRPYAIAGQRLLTNESPIQIRYVKRVTDAAQFDPLFVEVLILKLALKLLPGLSGMGSAAINLSVDIKKELNPLMSQVRALDRQETNTIGRAQQDTWVDVRATRGGRIDSRLGSSG